MLYENSFYPRPWLLVPQIFMFQRTDLPQKLLIFLPSLLNTTTFQNRSLLAMTLGGLW